MKYTGELDLRLAHLPAPPQSEDLTKTIFSLLKQMLTSLATKLTAAAPNLIYSILP